MDNIRHDMTKYGIEEEDAQDEKMEEDGTEPDQAHSWTREKKNKMAKSAKRHNIPEGTAYYEIMRVKKCHTYCRELVKSVLKSSRTAAR